MTTSLEGRSALITGAGKGIGAEIARRLSRDGAQVTLMARTAADVEGLAAEIRDRGGRATALVADLNDVDAFASLVDRAAADHGLDFLVHNAGGALPAALDATTAADLDAAFHFNVAAPFALTRAALGHLRARPGAAIVTITSMMGHTPGRGLITYGTVKAAADHLTRQLALELAPEVRVNAVAPGIVATDTFNSAVPPDVRDQIARATPMGRLGTESDVAAAVRWLLSEEASFVTGKRIEIDGGANQPLVPD